MCELILKFVEDKGQDKEKTAKVNAMLSKIGHFCLVKKKCYG
jgi:hypothetical protein